MRGKLLSTFRLGLSQWAPDHNTIDYAAIRDKHAQLAQPQPFWGLIPGKDLSQKTWHLLSNIFHEEQHVAFPSQPLGSSWSSSHYVLRLSGFSCTKHCLRDREGGQRDDRLGSLSEPPRGLHWDLADLTGASCSPCVLSQQVMECPIILKLTRLGFPKLFIVNQVSQSFSHPCGVPDAHYSVPVKPIHQNCWNPGNYSPQTKQLWHLFAYSDTPSISPYDF